MPFLCFSTVRRAEVETGDNVILRQRRGERRDTLGEMGRNGWAVPCFPRVYTYSLVQYGRQGRGSRAIAVAGFEGVDRPAYIFPHRPLDTGSYPMPHQ